MDPELNIELTTSLPSNAREKLDLADDDASGLEVSYVLSDESKARIHEKLVDALRVELAERRDTLGFSPGEELAMGQSIGQGIGQSIQI